MTNDAHSPNLQVIRKAWESDAFKERLLANPKQVLAEELGTDIPDDLEVVVHVQTPDTLHMILPPSPDFIDTDIGGQMLASARALTCIDVTFNTTDPLSACCQCQPDDC